MTLLRTNLDETAVAFWHPMKNGTIVLENPYVARTAIAATKATHAQQRTALTHIEVICDRPDVQPFLPLVLVANSHSVNMAEGQEGQVKKVKVKKQEGQEATRSRSRKSGQEGQVQEGQGQEGQGQEGQGQEGQDQEGQGQEGP